MASFQAKKRKEVEKVGAEKGKADCFRAGDELREASSIKDLVNILS